MNPAIYLKDVSCRMNDRTLLENANVIVQPGERIVVCGPSGSGKTTLLRAIAGLQRIHSGQIDLLGRPVAGLSIPATPPHRRAIGMLFQDLALWPSVSVRDNIKLACPAHLSRADRARRIDAIIGELQLTQCARRYPSTLSGGEQQRLALARVLISEPSILLLDEPFTGLDLELKRTVIGLIEGACLQRELTVVAVTHDPFEALLLDASRAVIIENARVREEIPIRHRGGSATSYSTRTANAWSDALGRMQPEHAQMERS